MLFKRLVYLFSTLLFVTSTVNTGSASSGDVSSSNLEWETLQQWKLPQSPVDIAHSLDGKYVFVLTQENKVLIYTAQGNLEGTVPVDKGVTAIDIAPRAEMLYLINGDTQTFTALSIDFIRQIPVNGSPTLGPEDAPVNITVFTDFECPYCKKIEPLIAEVQKKNSDAAKIVFKNMPLSFHQFADPAHRAAIAAGMQGKFWEFHDALFAAEKLSNQVIENIAKGLDLNMDKWKKDMQSQQVRQRISADIQQAKEAGVTGTPTIFINGRLLKNRSMQGFQDMINEELKKN